MKKTAVLPALFFAGVFFLSCTVWKTGDWNRLQDRNFHLTKFTYVNTYISKENAFEYMKSYRLNEILVMIEKHYNITIDRSEIDKFFKENDYNQLEGTAGYGYFNGVFVWKSDRKYQNSVEYEFRNTETNQWAAYRGYFINLIVNGTVRSVVSEIVEKDSDALVIEKLKEKLVFLNSIKIE